MWQSLVMFLWKTPMHCISIVEKVPESQTKFQKINSICLFSENAFWSFINRKKNDTVTFMLCCSCSYSEIQRIYEKMLIFKNSSASDNFLYVFCDLYVDLDYRIFWIYFHCNLLFIILLFSWFLSPFLLISWGLVLGKLFMIEN